VVPFLRGMRGASAGSTTPLLTPPEPEHRPAQPDPLWHRQPAPASPGSTCPGPTGYPGPTGHPGDPARAWVAARAGTTGLGIGPGLVDPVAEGGGEQPAESRDVLYRHPEGPDAAVVLPDAQHDQVPLRMPGDTQPSPALVEKHIPAGRQRMRVLHRPSVAAPQSRFKGRRPHPWAQRVSSQREADGDQPRPWHRPAHLECSFPEDVDLEQHNGRNRSTHPSAGQVFHILGGLVQLGPDGG
jgi:hypothetical protein